MVAGKADLLVARGEKVVMMWKQLQGKVGHGWFGEKAAEVVAMVAPLERKETVEVFFGETMAIFLSEWEGESRSGPLKRKHYGRHVAPCTINNTLYCGWHILKRTDHNHELSEIVVELSLIRGSIQYRKRFRCSSPVPETLMY